LEHLIANKEKNDRPKDKMDIEMLRRYNNNGEK
jgi:hypothetical protein